MQTQPAIPEPQAFTLAQAAKRLTLSPAGLNNLIRDGHIRTVRLGRRRVVAATELERVLREGTQATPAA